MIRLSLRALLGRPARSLLCVAGVAIGIAAVFLTSALGRGAQAEVLKGIAALGAELLVVRPAQVKTTAARKQIQGLATTLKLEDCHAIARLNVVEQAAPGLEGMLKVRSDGGTLVTKVLGTTPAFLRVRNFELSSGRFFDEEQDRTVGRFAVLGARVQRILFAGQDPVGQVIRIKGVPFEILGTLRSKGVSDDGADNDNQVFIPIRTAQQRVYNSRVLSTVFVSVRDPQALDRGEQQIRALLRERHRLERLDRPDDFAIQNQLKLMMARQQTANSLTRLTSGLAVLALLVAGTGILVLMLLSVRERTPEIGLRMAVGARQVDILIQFLGEAMVLSLAGGAVGAAFGLLGARVLSLATQWPTQVSPETGVVSLATAIGLGLASGLFPARKASRLPPVEALAQE